MTVNALVRRWGARLTALAGLWLDAPWPRQLTRIAVYATNRCNSRCRICGQWRAEPKIDLPADVVLDVLRSPALSPFATIEIEGGEFLLHPEAHRILAGLCDRRYTLVTNGLLDDELIAAVRAYRVPAVAVSLDGPPATYARVRGVDGYDPVVRTIETLRGQTELSVIYTFSPWNSQADYEHVRDRCRAWGVPLGYNIYSDMAYFDTDANAPPAPIPFEADSAGRPILNPYFVLYNRWLAGDVTLPCRSIRSRVVVYPDGRVPLCQQLDIALGNVLNRPLDAIWRDPRTVELQREHTGCNGCWVSYHRPFDLRLRRMKAEG
jgi:MoaA/NifB/PqqE/SkfB family radical SAM enzyme